LAQLMIIIKCGDTSRTHMTYLKKNKIINCFELWFQAENEKKIILQKQNDGYTAAPMPWIIPKIATCTKLISFIFCRKPYSEKW
jgi:hypothetical protein